MGSCVSVHKDPDSVLKLRLSIGSKNQKLLIPSPVKDKPDTVNVVDRTVSDVAFKGSPPRFRDAGSKDEGFFDSQPWLESDCEDDYYSINGDFTPSRGSTPIHHNFALPNQKTNKTHIEEQTTASIPEPTSPPDKKKRLSELFRESSRGDHDYTSASDETEPPGKGSSEAKSANGTPFLSGYSTERTTPNGVLRTEDKSSKSAQCCLPGLLSSRSFNERKKRLSSPARNEG